MYYFQLLAAFLSGKTMDNVVTNIHWKTQTLFQIHKRRLYKKTIVS